MDCAPRPDRRVVPRGVTLVELMVVLAVLGVMGGVVGLAWRGDGWLGPTAATGTAAIAAVRRQAVETGTPVTAVVTAGEATGRILALPDGRLIGAERFGFDPLSGRPLARDRHMGERP